MSEYELNKLEVKLPKFNADRLDETLETINRDLTLVPFTDSSIIEALADIWDDDEDKEHFGAILRKIETMRDENKGREIISKTFRIQNGEYNIIVRLKQALNKYNHSNDTIRLSDVISYLIQQYIYDVELELADSKDVSEAEAEEILKNL